MHRSSRRAVTMAGLVLGSVGAAAYAQAPGENAGGLEEIVVTARKQQESLQEAPIAVSAFTAETIAARGITDVNSLATYTPGLSFSQAFGRTGDRPVIRGQSNVLAGVQFGVESGAAYFIDGVYYNGDVQSLDFESLERVEVIKGPQSALYGRNTYSGAVNFITRDPGEEFGGRASATLADHEEYRVALSVDGPISDILSFRLGGRFNTYDGEYTNQLTGKTVGSEEDWSVNGTLVFKPTENFSARLFTMYREQEDGPLPLFLQGAEANNCQPGFRSIGYRGVSPVTGMASTVPAFGQLPPNANTNQYYCGEIAAQPNGVRLNTDAIPAQNGFPPFGDGTAFDGVIVHDMFSSLNLVYDIGGSGWTVSSLSGYRKKYDLFGADSDHSGAFSAILGPGAEPLFANTNRNDTREYSTELKLASPAENRLRGIVGAYYYYNDDQEKDLTYVSPETGVFNGNGNITGIRNEAVFGALTFDFTDKLTAGVELRYAEERKDRTEFIGAPTNGNGRDGTPRPLLEAEYSKTTPRFTLDYKLTDEILLYGIFAKGAKPGGINGSVGLPSGKPTYDQETSDNYEVGMKSEWLDNRLRVNASAYFIEATDVQVTQALVSVTGGAVTSIAVNQGGAEIKGLELEANAVFTDNLNLAATFSYVDAEFTEGCDDFEYVLNTGGLAFPVTAPGQEPPTPAECSIAGNRLPLVPEVQGSLVLNWDRPIRDELYFVASGSYSYEGSKYVQVHNLAETGETNLLGLRLGVRGENWSVIAFGRNLTDEDTIAIATRWFDLRYGSGRTGLAGTAPAASDAGTPRAFFGSLRKGRTYGLELRYSF